MKRILLPFLAAAPLCLISCATESHRPVDSFGAYNMLGGAARGNDYSSFSTPAASGLDAERYDSLEEGFTGPPLVLPDGRLVLVGGGKVALIRYRTVQRVIPFPDGELPLPGLSADAAGRIYLVSSTGAIHAFDSAGGPLWSHPLDAPSAAPVYYGSTLALEEGTVVGSSRGVLRRFDGGGARRWEVTRGAAIGPMIAADPGLGLAVAITFNEFGMTDTLAAIDPATGAGRWARAVEGARIIYGPVITRDMIVVGCASTDSLGDRKPFIAAFAPDGRALWRAQVPVMPRGISSDDQGNLYVAGSGAGRTFIGGAVLSLDPAGRQRWIVRLESGVPAAPAVTQGFVFFVSRRDGSTGLFTYDREGHFVRFVDLSLLPDAHAQPVISSDGVLLLTALDLPALLKGSGEGLIGRYF